MNFCQSQRADKTVMKGSFTSVSLSERIKITSMILTLFFLHYQKIKMILVTFKDWLLLGKRKSSIKRGLVTWSLSNYTDNIGVIYDCNGVLLY